MGVSLSIGGGTTVVARTAGVGFQTASIRHEERSS